MPEVNVVEFAEKVERLCAFLLDQLEATSDDVIVIKRLQEDAADLQAQNPTATQATLKGLADFMHRP